MSAPRCPKCGRELVESLGLLECLRPECMGVFYEAVSGGRLREVPFSSPGLEDDLAEEKLVDTVADRWTPDMARSSIRGAKR